MQYLIRMLFPHTRYAAIFVKSKFRDGRVVMLRIRNKILRAYIISFVHFLVLRVKTVYTILAAHMHCARKEPLQLEWPPLFNDGKNDIWEL